MSHGHRCTLAHFAFGDVIWRHEYGGYFPRAPLIALGLQFARTVHNNEARWTSPIRRVIESASAYDVLQFAVGANWLRRRLAVALATTAGRTVLDVGAGTGLYAASLPHSSQYIWFDKDPSKLRGFLRRRRMAHAVLGDATQISLNDRSIDYAMCVGITHHLNDTDLASLVSELWRVSRHGIVVLDSVASGRWLSYPLWKLDRGSFARPRAALIEMFSSRFRIDAMDEFSVFHRYVLMTASPIAAESAANGRRAEERPTNTETVRRRS